MNRKMVSEELVKISKMLVASSRYGWIIDNDYISGGSDNRKGTSGPRGISPEMLHSLKSGEGDKFQMFDDDKELYYSGRIVGDYYGFEPLDDFGEPNAGCTLIKYVSGPNKGRFL